MSTPYVENAFCETSMKHSDFARGLEFYTGFGKWRCTDVGTRVITAISLEPRTLVTVSVGSDGERVETYSMSTDPRDLNGPPYGVVEHVFDEYDFGGCALDSAEFRTSSLNNTDLVSAPADPRRSEPSSIVHIERAAELDVPAATGLVALSDRLCVVDAERLLTGYDFTGRPLGRVALWPGEPPNRHAQHNPPKPNLRALTRLHGGRLLALSSGSTAQEQHGALIDPSTGSVQHLDLAPLYELLATRVRHLNIEGATVVGDQLWLAHRGQGRAPQNACIELGLDAIEALLAGSPTLEPGTLRAVHTIDLGEMDGMPLGLTGLAALPNHGLLFCAAAQSRPNAHQGAACAKSVIGRVDPEGRVVRLARVSERCKLEGIALVGSRRSSIEVWLVAGPGTRAPHPTLFRATYVHELVR